MAQLLTGWKADLEALKVKLATVEGLAAKAERVVAERAKVKAIVDTFMSCSVRDKVKSVRGPGSAPQFQQCRQDCIRSAARVPSLRH